ncbi:hypothetical protein TNCV_2186611 [Trichonephila clavipes]|nr:hypothetical protein TNCV_2186611 [Trichonephila clavipes]
MTPNLPPKMMPTWLYRQDFAKFSLNRHYNISISFNSIRHSYTSAERRRDSTHHSVAFPFIDLWAYISVKLFPFALTSFYCLYSYFFNTSLTGMIARSLPNTACLDSDDQVSPTRSRSRRSNSPIETCIASNRSKGYLPTIQSQAG